MNPGPFLPPHTVQERDPIIRCFIGKDGLENGDAFDYEWIVCKQNNLLFLTGGCFYVGACSTIRFVLEAEHYISNKIEFFHVELQHPIVQIELSR